MNTRVDQFQSSGSSLSDSVEVMMRLPFRMTGASIDLMMQGVQRMMGGGSGTSSATHGHSNGTSASYESKTSTAAPATGSGSSWTSLFTGGTHGLDQDLSGDDLKYVIWSIVFTKPGYECILQKQQEELVNYAADSNTYAAVKIAGFLDSARHGHSKKPEAWGDRDYPSDSSTAHGSDRRTESSTVTTPGSTTIIASTSSSSSSTSSMAGKSEGASSRASGEAKGWRIPPEDQKFIAFLYKVDRRLPKQEEVTRVERVTVERGTRIV